MALFLLFLLSFISIFTYFSFLPFLLPFFLIFLISFCLFFPLLSGPWLPFILSLLPFTSLQWIRFFIWYSHCISLSRIYCPSYNASFSFPPIHCLSLPLILNLLPFAFFLWYSGSISLSRLIDLFTMHLFFPLIHGLSRPLIPCLPPFTSLQCIPAGGLGCGGSCRPIPAVLSAASVQYWQPHRARGSLSLAQTPRS